MFINTGSNSKRKFNDLNGFAINTFNPSKLFKNTKKIKKTNGDGDGDEDGDGDADADDEGQSNPFKFPGIYGKKDDDSLIYLKENHLYFHVEISEESVDEVKKLMRQYWNKYNKITKTHLCVEYKPKPLYIHIFSPGGCVYSGFSLYDFIIEYKKKIPVYTVVEGKAASAATLISIAGTKRFMTPNSIILIHQLSTFFGGTYHQIKDEFENTKKCMDKIMEIYKAHTKINKKKLPKILKHDLEWDASQCIEFGIVDKIKLIDVFNDDEN